MLIAQKLVEFAGQKFKIGEEIPEGLVLPEAKTRLIKNGFIAEAAGAGSLLPAQPSLEVETIAVPILAEEGKAEMDMTIEDILTAIETVQKTEEEILADIETIEQPDVLILVDVIKGATEPIHSAAEARAKAIAGVEEEAPEAYTNDGLMAETRDKLVEIATGLGIEVAVKDNKQNITDKILEHQAGSDA